MALKAEKNLERLRNHTSCVYNFLGIPINKADRALEIYKLYQTQQQAGQGTRVMSDIYLDVSSNSHQSDIIDFPEDLGVGVESRGFVTFADRRIPFEGPNLSHLSVEEVVEASKRNYQKMRRLIGRLGVNLPERPNIWDSTNLYGTRLPA